MARQGTIGGRVYRSDIGPAAGLENIALSLSRGGAASTLTDTDGFFHFDGLPAGALYSSPSASYRMYSSRSVGAARMWTWPPWPGTEPTSLSSCAPVYRRHSTRSTGQPWSRLFLPTVANAGNLGSVQRHRAALRWNQAAPHRPIWRQRVSPVPQPPSGSGRGERRAERTGRGNWQRRKPAHGAGGEGRRSGRRMTKRRKRNRFLTQRPPDVPAAEDLPATDPCATPEAAPEATITEEAPMESEAFVVRSGRRYRNYGTSPAADRR